MRDIKTAVFIFFVMLKLTKPKCIIKNIDI